MYNIPDFTKLPGLMIITRVQTRDRALINEEIKTKRQDVFSLKNVKR